MDLGIDWLYAINPLIKSNTHPLSMYCKGETVRVLTTKAGCSHTSVKVCALKVSDENDAL